MPPGAKAKPSRSIRGRVPQQHPPDEVVTGPALPSAAPRGRGWLWEGSSGLPLVFVHESHIPLQAGRAPAAPGSPPRLVRGCQSWGRPGPQRSADGSTGLTQAEPPRPGAGSSLPLPQPWRGQWPLGCVLLCWGHWALYLQVQQSHLLFSCYHGLDDVPQGSWRLVPSSWCCWELVEPLGGGAWWEEVRSLGVCH